MSVGWLVGRLVDVTIKFFIHSDPVPPNTSQYRPILTQYHHISLSLNVPRDNVPCNKFPRDNVPCDNVSRDNVPRDNVLRDNIPQDKVLQDNVLQDNCSSLQYPSQQCSSQKLFLVTIVPQFLYKWSFAKRTANSRERRSMDCCK